VAEQWVGRPIAQIDAADKLRGETRYLGDVTLPGMLDAVLVRSPVAHGVIRHIDTSKARRVPGVRAVITGADVRAPAFGPYVPDWEVLAQDKVRFVGDDVVAIAATTLDAAREAAALVRLEIDELPAVFDAYEALAPGAPVIWEQRPGNVATDYDISRNDVARAMDEADHVFEASFSTSRIYHGYLEPIVTIAEYHDNGSYTMHVPTHIPLKARLVYARGLGVGVDRIRLIIPPIGGSFGAKYEMTVPLVAASLSRVAGAPVRIAYEREEDAAVNHPRPPFVFHHRIGVRDDGKFVARTTDVVGTAGARTFWSPTVLATTVHRVDALYDFGAMSGTGRLVYTNESPTTCMRGFGNAEALFGIEQMIDEIADRLHADPVDLRLRNAVQEGQTTMHGWLISSSKLPDCLDRARKLSGYDERRRQGTVKGSLRRGIGLAIGHHVAGYSAIHADFDGSSAIIRLGLDGSVAVFVGEPDLGQGHKTVLAQLAADRLGLSPVDITVHGVDSALSPDSVGTLASRGTTLAGQAVLAAADDALAKLAGFRAESGHTGTLRETVKAYADAHAGLPLLAQGVYRPPTVKPDENKYGNPSAAYPFAAHVAEVEVDTDTGQTRLVHYWAVHDSGTIINPATARSQVAGAVAQGAGWALLENVDLSGGVMRNPNFLDYRIPGAGDMPRLEVEFVDGYEPNGPMGAKSLGEVAINPVVAAIANAVHDAVGVRCTELPISPERLWTAIHDRSRPDPIVEVSQ
jgi:CO/xanthine dehydrogenase Mo-binding subunit